MSSVSQPAAGERVLGVGVDLVETARLREALGQWGARFRDRVFRPEEQRYCEAQAAPWRHYAGRFALKEAVSKAFGTGIGDRVGWLDIEVIRDEGTGAPSIRLSGSAGRLAAAQGVTRVFVSLSHAHEFAVAQAVLVGPGRPAAGGPGGQERRAP